MRRAVTLCVVLLLSATVSVGIAQAAECHQNVVVYDPGDTGLQGQLRGAIVDVCDGGTIRLRAGIVISLEQGKLIVPSGKSITILSPSQAPSATIDAQGVSRVIWVQAGAGLTLRNLIVRGGLGAGIHNEGSLTIASGRVTRNTGFGITNTAGAVTLTGDTAIEQNQGSGVFNAISTTGEDVTGRLTLEDDSTINANVASIGGGILNGGAVTLNDNSSVSGNVAEQGGGIWNAPDLATDSGLVTLNDDSHISGNEAEVGGGIFNAYGVGGGAIDILNDRSRITDNVGGGISGDEGGQVSLNDDSTIASNTGGGIFLARAYVVLNDRSIVADNEGVGVSVLLGGGVTLNGESAIVGNGGPGVQILLVPAILNDSSRISQNEGGGIVSQLGRVILNDYSVISGNTSQNGGGGIRNEDGVVVLNEHSSITGNVAKLGGGIYNGFEFGGSVTLNDDSSIVGNVATDGLGGGIYSEPGSSVTLNDASSITANVPDNCFPSSDC